LNTPPTRFLVIELDAAVGEQLGSKLIKLGEPK